MTEDEKINVEIKTMTGMAKEPFSKKMTNSMNKEVKRKILKTNVECAIVWSGDMDTAETRYQTFGSIYNFSMEKSGMVN